MEDFKDRLLYIFENYFLNATTFADKIGVQRSSMSHILSGRNKPSLDFILKIYDAFPEINLPWLTLGEGEFSKKNINSTQVLASTTLLPKEKEEFIKNDEIEFEVKNFTTDTDEITPDNTLKNDNNIDIPNPLLENKSEPIIEEEKVINTNQLPVFDEKIDQVMIFYKDGTFKTFHPR